MRSLRVLIAAGLAAILALPALAQQTRPNIVIAVEGLFRTMEPIDGNSTTGGRVHLSIYDEIITRNFTEDPDGSKLKPAIAERWEASQDNKLWKLFIRRGVKFHDGSELTAEDVAFTLSAERIWGEKALVPAGRRYTEAFKRVEATDRYTVEVELTTGDPNLPYRFITPLGYVVPKAYFLRVGAEGFGQKPIGTGPYKVVSFDGTSHIRLEAFDEYWGGRPPVARVEFRVVPEFSARLAGMVSGEFDMMASVPFDEIPTIQRYRNLRYVSKLVDNYVMLAFNTLNIPEFGPNPVADRNLRYAMTAAIDREGLVKSLWGDATYAPAPFNFPDFTVFHDSKIRPFIEYDLEKAKQYLRQSNYRGQEIVVNVTRSAFPNFDLAVQYLAEKWREIGINAKLNVVDSWALALKHPFGLLNMSMTTEFDGTPTRAIWGFWGPESARATRAADRSWTPPAEFVAIGRRYLASTDTPERIRLFREMVRIWEEDAPALILWRNVGNWVVRDNVSWIAMNSTRMALGPGYLTVNARR